MTSRRVFIGLMPDGAADIRIAPAGADAKTTSTFNLLLAGGFAGLRSRPLIEITLPAFSSGTLSTLGASETVGSSVLSWGKTYPYPPICFAQAACYNTPSGHRRSLMSAYSFIRSQPLGGGATDYEPDIRREWIEATETGLQAFRHIDFSASTAHLTHMQRWVSGYANRLYDWAANPVTYYVTVIEPPGS